MGGEQRASERSSICTCSRRQRRHQRLSSASASRRQILRGAPGPGAAQVGDRGRRPLPAASLCTGSAALTDRCLQSHSSSVSVWSPEATTGIAPSSGRPCGRPVGKVALRPACRHRGNAHGEPLMQQTVCLRGRTPPCRSGSRRGTRRRGQREGPDGPAEGAVCGSHESALGASVLPEPPMCPVGVLTVLRK